MELRRASGVAAAALIGLALVSGCGGKSGSASDAASASVVTDHVHAAVEAASPPGILLATHYGLLTSTDAGRRWKANPGLGDDMISGLVHARGRYAAALMPSTESSTATTAPSTSAAPVEVSVNGKTWTVANGIPAGSTVTALVQGAGRTVWAPVLGVGVYRSDDEGLNWLDVIPAKVPITTVAVVGANLVIATDSGIFVTGTDSPIMPALPQFTASVDDVETSARCPDCVVATLSNGGVAVSGNGGVTWSRRPFHVPFESVASPAGAPKVLIGMSAEPAAKTQGLWRSTDNGKTWRRVLSVPLVDHLYEVPGKGSGRPELLAFQWGIQVYASHDDGRTWRRLARAGGVPSGGAMASTPGQP
jgi:photosystem II stability/assembly factor-like uncharacterized protein